MTKTEMTGADFNELVVNIRHAQSILKSMSTLLEMGEDIDSLDMTDMALDYVNASERLLCDRKGD